MLLLLPLHQSRSSPSSFLRINRSHPERFQDRKMIFRQIAISATPRGCRSHHPIRRLHSSSLKRLPAYAREIVRAIIAHYENRIAKLETKLAKLEGRVPKTPAKLFAASLNSASARQTEAAAQTVESQTGRPKRAPQTRADARPARRDRRNYCAAAPMRVAVAAKHFPATIHGRCGIRSSSCLQSNRSSRNTNDTGCNARVAALRRRPRRRRVCRPAKVVRGWSPSPVC